MSHDTDTIRPTTAYAAAAPLGLLLTDIAVGTSQMQPSRRNRRFADPG